MITELQIGGFKSFGSPAERLALGKLNFVVGANASGKTNLISSLRFLQYAITQDIEYAVNEFGGSAAVKNAIRTKGNRAKPPSEFLTIQVVLDPNSSNMPGKDVKHRGFSVGNMRYVLKVKLGGSSGVPEIVSEDFEASLLGKDHEKKTYRLRRTGNTFVIEDPTASKAKSEGSTHVPFGEEKRSAVAGLGFFQIPLAIFRRHVSTWRFYNISPHLARLPYKETPDSDLGPAGEYLGVVLHRLEQEKDKSALNRIVTGLKSAVPGFRRINTKKLPVEGKWAFQIREDKIQGAMNPDSVSDGTIRLLALMVIASWGVREASLIVVEEPENGVHPHLSEYIVEILRETSKTTQLIVTTHNPDFLDWLSPGEVILCDKKDGYTRARHASDISQIETFQKHFKLGELWTQGTLGGIP